MINNYVDEKRCCGCENCVLVCPKQAIKMEQDKEGFFQPHVDEEKCIGCKVCINKCPILNTVNLKNKIKGDYFGYICDDAACRKSASGGIAQAMYKYVIEHNGVIYGVEYKDDFQQVEYRRVEDKNYDKLLGTKYSQARKKSIFKSVLTDLEDGRFVLFIGVPCDIGALKIYLGKEYDNMITVQLVCMGVTSPRIFKEMMKTILHDSSKIKDIKERFTYKNWSIPFISIHTDEKKYLVPFDTSYYAYAFNSLGRKSCYDCKYKGDNRVADITIGDFWGGENYVHSINKNGMSVFSAHTIKGNQFLYKCELNIHELYDSYDWRKNNPFAYRSRNALEKRVHFSENFVMNDYDIKKASKKTMNFLFKVKWRVGRMVPSFLWTEVCEAKMLIDRFVSRFL